MPCLLATARAYFLMVDCLLERKDTSQVLPEHDIATEGAKFSEPPPTAIRPTGRPGRSPGLFHDEVSSNAAIHCHLINGSGSSRAWP